MVIRDLCLALLALLPAAACTTVDGPDMPPPAAVAAPAVPAARAAPAVAAMQAAPAPRAERAGDLLVVHEPDDSLPAECAGRRRALAAALGGPGVVWIEAQDGAELDLDRFFQQDDFWYLAGVDIPDIALALVIDETGALADEVLFLPPHDDDYEVWNGRRLSPGAEAEAATGFRRTARISTLATRATPAQAGEEQELLAGWAPKTVWVLDETTTLRTGRPLPASAVVDSTRARAALDALRLRKSPYEIDCLRAAIDITCAALREAVAEVEPGAFEYEPWGAIDGAFLRLGAERAGFASICGSGPHSVTLHYNANRRQMEAGDLLVMDVGAKYRYYCADVTRTVPVSGTFTPRQRQVYELVLAAQTAAHEAAKPGVTMAELDAIARKVIDEGGFGPGRTYFKHSLGHWIGLDVHDVGGRAPIEPGMAFTIEPGIYIADENLGVRIEDDYLMTETGAVKLSTGIPSDPDEIEALFRR
jgi:Xaa-Pro aminopeptidase